MCASLYRLPCTPIRAAVVLRSTTSSADSGTWVAPAFSASRLRRRVPGIGAIQGRWASSQASAICPGVAPLAAASPATWSTSAWFAVRFSALNRGLVARTTYAAGLDAAWRRARALRYQAPPVPR